MPVRGGDPIRVCGSLDPAQAGSNGTCCWRRKRCGCTLKLAQGWRRVRSAVSETAREDADGASERRDNATALSIARLRYARGTGIYEQFLPPCHFQRAEHKLPTPIHTNGHLKCMRIGVMTQAHYISIM